jgi:hypothetical protein
MMAAAACFYHADQVASTACAQCHVPLCGQCVETVANRPVRRNCVGAIRARVAAEMNTSAGPSAGPSAYPSAMPTVTAAVSGNVLPGLSPVGLLLGLVFGASIGAVGAFLLAQIELHTGMELGLLNSLVGFGCGYGVLLGCKRGGLFPAVLGGVLAFFAMMLAEYFWFSGTTLSQQETFAAHLGHMGSGWIFVAIGVYGGARTPLRAVQRSVRGNLRP